MIVHAHDVYFATDIDLRNEDQPLWKCARRAGKMYYTVGLHPSHCVYKKNGNKKVCTVADLKGRV